MVAITSDMWRNLFSNGHCRPPPLVGGRLLPRDFWSPLIPEGREARLNDSRVHLLIRAPLSRRRNSTGSYIVHYRFPSDRCPHGVQRTWGEISEQQAEQVFNKRQIIIKRKRLDDCAGSSL
jgi:hypothetical protein